jgi:hypothetical protein
MQLAVRQDLKKGDVVVAEGDLYQRIYTVAEGQLQMKSGDHTFVTIQEGEVFGYVIIFLAFLIPSHKYFAFILISISNIHVGY